MSKKEVAVLSQVPLSLLPCIERRVVKVCPVSDSELSEAAEVIEAPLLFLRADVSLVEGNKQVVLHILEAIVLESHVLVCIDFACGQELRFILEFFFYMNDVKVAFRNSASQRYEVFNGAPRKERDCDRGIFQELYPVN